MKIITSLRSQFQSLFHEEPLIVKSPGRINLIGEHTDYNEGFVLPAAIDKGIYVAVGKRSDNQIHLYSVEFSAVFTTEVDHVAISSLRWPNYILGVVDQLNKSGRQIGGFNLCIDGDLPIGAGLSSSAAVECATLFALNEMFEIGLNKKEIALLAQKAEHEFAGVKCGIMDQFASVMGKDHHLIKLDCRSLAYEYIPFDFDDIEIALFDTQIKHELASSEYNIRRGSCEQGVAMVQKNYPQVNSLRDISMQMLEESIDSTSDVYKKCTYVIEEIQRLQDGCKHLQNQNLGAFGKLMLETHDGLRNLYNVSCSELDFLVDEVKTNEHVLGARMMGGGFGGCTINLIKKGNVPAVFEQLNTRYQQAFNKSLFCYIVRPGDGTQVVS